VTHPSHGAAGKVLALIVTHNSPATLRETVAGILAQSTPPGGVLVVDNASEPTAAAGLAYVVADHEGQPLAENLLPAPRRLPTLKLIQKSPSRRRELLLASQNAPARGTFE